MNSKTRFCEHFWGVDSLILKPPCKGECPTGSEWSPSYMSLDFVFFWVGGLGRKEAHFWILMVKKPDIFSGFLCGSFFFNNKNGFSKKNERTSPPNIFFSSHNMFSFQKEMHKKPLMFCSTYLRTFFAMFHV